MMGREQTVTRCHPGEGPRAKKCHNQDPGLPTSWTFRLRGGAVLNPAKATHRAGPTKL